MNKEKLLHSEKIITIGDLKTMSDNSTKQKYMIENKTIEELKKYITNIKLVTLQKNNAFATPQTTILVRGVEKIDHIQNCTYQ